MKKIAAVLGFSLLLLTSAMVLGKLVGVIDVRTNFTGTIEFPESVNLGKRFIGEEIKVADIWVKNATVPLKITLVNGTNAREEWVVFWLTSPVKKEVLPLEFNTTTNITSAEYGNYTIWQRGNKVGPVRGTFLIECEHCEIEE